VSEAFALPASHGHSPSGVLRRYWDPRHAAWVVKLGPGDYYVTTEGETLVTVLGSCVAACVRDPVAGVGGMNHFMLPVPPANPSDGWSAHAGLATRYGSASMEQLINSLIARGARRNRLEFKLFGGGRVLAGATDVGKTNVEFALDFVKRENYQLLASDLGGPWPRQVAYEAQTGRARIRHLNSANSREVADEEERFLHKVQDTGASAGEVELFGD